MVGDRHIHGVMPTYLFLLFLLNSLIKAEGSCEGLLSERSHTWQTQKDLKYGLKYNQWNIFFVWLVILSI